MKKLITLLLLIFCFNAKSQISTATMISNINDTVYQNATHKITGEKLNGLLKTIIAYINGHTSSSTGTVTSVATGYGLTGGTITTTGTIVADTSAGKLATDYDVSLKLAKTDTSYLHTQIINKLNYRDTSLLHTEIVSKLAKTDTAIFNASDFNQSGHNVTIDYANSRINNQRIGTLFNDYLSNGSNYTQVHTSGTQTFSGNSVTMTGGNGSFSTNYMIYNYNTNGTYIEDFTISTKFVSTANSSGTYGFGLGMDVGNNSAATFSAFIKTNAVTNRGQVVIVDQFSNTILATSTSNLSYINSTDTIEISLRCSQSKLLVTVKNLTTTIRTESAVLVPNTVTVSYDMTAVMRVNRPAIYTYGGTQVVTNLKMESELFQNPSFVIMGDSRVAGSAASSVGRSYASLIGARRGKSMVWARGGATISALNNNISELSSIAKTSRPHVLIMAGINDAIALSTLATFQTDYLALLQSIQTFGTPLVGKIANVKSDYANAAAVNALINSYNTWIITLPFKVIDENTVTTSAGTLNASYTSDGVHFDDYGNFIVAKTLITQLELFHVLQSTLAYEGTSMYSPAPLRVGVRTGGALVANILTGEGDGTTPTIMLNDGTATSSSSFQMTQNSTNGTTINHYNSSFAGNFTFNSSVAKAGTTDFFGGSTYQLPVVFGFLKTYFPQGQTSTNIGMSMTATGMRIDANSNLHTASTAYLHIKGGTSTASNAPLKLTRGAVLTTAEQGAWGYGLNGRLFFSPTTTWKNIPVSDTAAAGNGKLLIGNGTDYTVANLTAGINQIITNGSGTITIDNDTTAGGTKLATQGDITRAMAAAHLTGSATLDFASTGTQNSSDLTITVTGAADGDAVYIGVPNGSTLTNSGFTAWVSATNTVTIRFNNYSAGAQDPASGTFKAVVYK